MGHAIAQLRDGTEVGAWLLKASPAVWDIGAALSEGVELDWWRLAPTYRADLLHAGHPCAMWVTRGDPRVRSGVWAVGEVVGDPEEDVGDPDDPLWRDEAARRQLRPRVPVSLDVVTGGIAREQIAEDPRLARTEILRVPRVGNPAALTPDEWEALCDMVGELRLL